MKKLVSAGVELSLTSRSGVASGFRLASAKPFPDPGAFHEDPPPFDLLCSFTLKDGHVYGYRYPGLDDVTLDDFRVALLSKSYPPGPPQAAGGLLFNASVRSTCSDKFLIS
jgi:hypothetical protein